VCCSNSGVFRQLACQVVRVSNLSAPRVTIRLLPASNARLLSAGEYLDEAADTTCTWVSPDGGITWNDVLPSAAIYEVHDSTAAQSMTLRCSSSARQ
jgi:hypothetical protein